MIVKFRLSLLKYNKSICRKLFIDNMKFQIMYTVKCKIIIWQEHEHIYLIH